MVQNFFCYAGLKSFHILIAIAYTAFKLTHMDKIHKTPIQIYSIHGPYLLQLTKKKPRLKTEKLILGCQFISEPTIGKIIIFQLADQTFIYKWQ